MRPDELIPYLTPLNYCQTWQAQLKIFLKMLKVKTELLTMLSARRMFPSLKVSVSGLGEETLYDIWLVIKSLDCRRYRYVYQRYLLPLLCYKAVNGPGGQVPAL